MEINRKVRLACKEGMAKVIGQEAATVPIDAPSSSLGFDSLSGMEFGMTVEGDFGLSLPMDAVGDATTISDLATFLIATIQDAALQDTA